jgi:hypothetical protein
MGHIQTQEARDALIHTLLGHLLHMLLLSSQSVCLAVDDDGHARQRRDLLAVDLPLQSVTTTYQQNQHTSPATISTAPMALLSSFTRMVGPASRANDCVALLAAGYVCRLTSEMAGKQQEYEKPKEKELKRQVVQSLE